MNDQIKNISLKFACPADWDAMDWVNGAKHCAHCQKKVYDFTNAKQQEFLMILAENNNNVCGRFRRDQMAVKLPVLPGWRKWVSAAMILIGVNVFNNKAVAQDVRPKMEKNSIKPVLDDAVIGEPMLPYEKYPEFPGGSSAFAKFIESHLRSIQGAAGQRIILSFVIEADGELNSFKIVRGLNKEANKEVLRVIRLSPKWKPAMQNGKPVKVPYMMPITFK